MSNTNTSGFRRIGLRIALTAAPLLIVATPRLAAAASTPFGTLEMPFTQQLYAVTSGFVGGTSFDPNGNLVVDNCDFGSSPLIRFDKNTTVTVHGSVIHQGTSIGSNAGCGLALFSPDQTFYSNTSAGVANLDPSTGATIRTIGAGGNALGIAVDPVNHHLVYDGAGCRSTGVCPIEDLDPTTGTTTTLTTLSGTSFADGIAFDPTGQFIFLSTRSPIFALTVIKRDGTFVRNVPMNDEPDGISFHGSSPKFVVTDDTDGNMTRFDFPGDDYTQVPTVSSFASGGFRGDLSVVGPDGCIYVPQDGTRYADGTVTSEDSIVQICSGFSSTTGITPPTPPSCALTAVIAGPPKQLQITVQDTSSGLASVQVTESNNATVSVPTFTAGDTGAIVVVATKIDQTQGAQVALHLTDVNGLTTDCDPVVPGEPVASNTPSVPTGPSAGGCSVGRASGAAALPGVLGALLGLALIRRRRNAV